MPRLHVRLGLHLFGAIIAALTLAWGAKVALAALWPHGPSLTLPPQLAGLLANRDSVAHVLARPPVPGETFELDAYCSGAAAGQANLPARWPRHAEARCSVPCPPSRRVELVDAETLTPYNPHHAERPVLLRIHPGETHHDPYDPQAPPSLLVGQTWQTYAQAGASQGLVGYRLDGAAEAGACSVSYSDSRIVEASPADPR